MPPWPSGVRLRLGDRTDGGFRSFRITSRRRRRIVPATPSVRAQSKQNRGGRDKPGHDPAEMAVVQYDREPETEPFSYNGSYQALLLAAVANGVTDCGDTAIINQVVMHARKLGTHLGVDLKTEDDRRMHDLLQSDGAMLDWIAVPNFLAAYR